MTVYAWLITAFWLVFLIVWVVSAFGAKKTIRRSTKAMLVRIILLVAVLVFFHAQIFGGTSENQVSTFNPLLNTIGVVLCGAGIAFAIWARLNLGKNWGMPMSVKENPELVTSGPYRYVRHPIYTGMIFAFLGSAVGESGWWFLVLIAFGVYFIYAATREEKLMTKEFPNQYPEYKKSTKMLIPFIF